MPNSVSMKPPQRRRFRFSLWTFMVFMTLCAVGLGMFGSRFYQARRQRAAVQAILANGGMVQYKSIELPPDESGMKPIWGNTHVLRQKGLLERCFGIDFVDRLVAVSYDRFGDP